MTEKWATPKPPKKWTPESSLTFNPIKERWIDNEETGGFHIEKTQNVDGIIDAARDLPDLIKKDTGPGDGRLIGTVPLLLAYEWARESKTRVGSKEWAKYAKRKLKDPEFAYFRVFKQ